MAKLLKLSDYGVYVSCITFYTFLTMLASTVQSTSARLAAQSIVIYGQDSIWRVFRVSLKGLVTTSILFFIILLPFSNFFSEISNIQVDLILITLTSALTFSPYALTLGCLQGLQKFKLFGIGLVAAPFGRFIVGLSLVTVGFGIKGAVVSLPLAVVVGFFLNLVLLFILFRHQKKTGGNNQPQPKGLSERLIIKAFLSTGSIALVGSIGFIFLTSIDVLLVQSYAAGETSGIYAAVATLGKIVIYFTAPLPVVLLPKVAQRSAQGGNSRILLRKYFLANLGLGSLALLFLTVGGGLMAKLFTSNFPTELIWLIPFYGGAMLLMSFVSIWLAYYIVLKNRLFLYSMFPVVGLQIYLIILWHSSLQGVILSIYIAGLLLVLLGEFCFWTYKNENTDTKLAR